MPRSRSASGAPRPPDPGVVVLDGRAVGNFRDIGLLHEVLDLPHAFAMADIVLHRCGIDPSEAMSVSQRILVVDLPPECFLKVDDLRSRFPALCVEEAFSFMIGYTRPVETLVLGDPINRRVAVAEGIHHRVPLWLIQQLLERRLLDSTRARQCLDRCGRIPGMADAGQLLDSYLSTSLRRRGP